MNLNSNRPTAISRLIWDTDFEPKNNKVIKGDLIGRLARYCSLTHDSSSGVLCVSFPKRTGGRALSSTSNLGNCGVVSSVSGTLDLTELFNSFGAPVVSSDGLNVYYWDGDCSDLGELKIDFILYCTAAHRKGGYGGGFDFNTSGTIKLIDSNGLLVETISVPSINSKVPGIGNYSSGVATVSVRTISVPLDFSSGVRHIQYSFSTSSRASYDNGWSGDAANAYARGLYMEVPGFDIYYSGV